MTTPDKIEELMEEAGFINWNQFTWEDLVKKFNGSSSGYGYVMGMAEKQIATAKREVAKEILDNLIYVMHTLDIKPDVKDYVVNEIRKRFLGTEEK